MLWTRRSAADDSVVVTRGGETSWILRPSEALEGHTIDVLRNTFLEAADSGAQNVVVDLSDTDTIASEGAATLVTMAELMLGRGGVLWIAARWAEGAGHTLRPIEEHGPNALVGVTQRRSTRRSSSSRSTRQKTAPPAIAGDRSSETFTYR